jgi:hypothetical protein
LRGKSPNQGKINWKKIKPNQGVKAVGGIAVPLKGDAMKMQAQVSYIYIPP